VKTDRGPACWYVAEKGRPNRELMASKQPPHLFPCFGRFYVAADLRMRE
jgi:hypothetical protein